MTKEFKVDVIFEVSDDISSSKLIDMLVLWAEKQGWQIGGTVKEYTENEDGENK